MAYDPNDAADVAIVEGLVADATKELKTKNVELLGEKKKLQKQISDGAADPKAIEKLETQIEKLETDLEAATTSLKETTKKATKAEKLLETETGFTRNLLVDNGLTEALVKANVAKQFLPAVKALFAGKVEIKTEGTERKAFIGDKPLGDAITAFAQSDEGKHYVAAGNNRGGNAPGADGGAVGKSVTRSAFDAMAHDARNAFLADKGTITDG